MAVDGSVAAPLSGAATEEDSPLEEAAEAVAPWICRLARVGFVAKGLMYVVVGALAAGVAAGIGGETTDGRGALSAIHQQPFGRTVLAISVLGFAAYAAWRLIAAIRDTEHKGSGIKGIARRSVQAGSGIIALGLAVQAARVLTGAARGEARIVRQWTTTFINAPAGRWLVALAGACTIGYALFQFYKAAFGNVRKHMLLRRVSDVWKRRIERMARFGIAARGIVFMVIGWFLIVAARRFNPRAAQDVSDALDTLRNQTWGDAVLAVVAAGLISYGLLQFTYARYRRVEVD